VELTALKLGLRRDFTWRFVIADVQVTIIDVNLLTHYGLLVDCRHNRLLDGVTSLSTPSLIPLPTVPSMKVIAGGPPPDSLIEEFPELLKHTRIHRGAAHHPPHSYNTRSASSLPPAASCR
jgi:hypothetical protein